MHRFASNFGCKGLGLSKNINDQIGTWLSWSRNSAAKKTNFGVESRHITNHVASDGANSATIRIRAIFAEGSKSVATAMNAMDLRGSGSVGGVVGLPDSRVLFTVLRSPHIDKKSREQFEMRIKKRLLVIKTEARELSKKYFWLKRLRVFGAQYEILISCKTRVDKREILEKIAQIGGTSEAEAGEKIDSVTDALKPPKLL